MYIRRVPVVTGRILLVLTVLAAAATVLLEIALRPAMETVVQQVVQARAAEAINRAVLDHVVRRGISYADLYRADKNKDGLITFLQPNTTEINRVASAVQLDVQAALRKMQDQYWGVTLSQVLGSRLFAARGPSVTVRMESVGNVRVNVDSRFDQAGLNQSRHIVYLLVKAEVQAVAPLMRKTFSVEQQVPLAEGIIVGPVPSQGLFSPLPR